jgi:hypothetical protein
MPAASSAATQSAIDGWSIFAAIATGASAIATAASAWLIYRQIRQTRESVRAANEAVLTSEKQAAAAQQAIVEGQKALIASQMSRISVEASGPINDEVWRFDAPNGWTTTSVQQAVSPDFEFVLPRDHMAVLGLRYIITVANDGPGRAQLTLFTSAPPSVLVNQPPPSPQQFMLLPGGSMQFVVWRLETVEDWVRLAHAYDPYRTSDYGETDREIARVFYPYNADFGANEGHPVVASGSILEPLPGNASGWQLRDLKSLAHGYATAVAAPFERTYWRSKARNERLD